MSWKIKFLIVLKLLIIITILFTAMISSNNDNAMPLSKERASLLYSIIPQGWAFFTREPKEDIINFYEIKGKNLILLNEGASLNVKHIFGFNRISRKLSIDLSTLYLNVPKKLWTDFKFSEQSLEKQKIYFATSEMLENKDLKGEFLLTKTRRKPWAWQSGNVEMPISAVKIFIR